MFSFFKKKPKPSTPPLTIDVHSHLLPALDDGVKSLEEAEEIILFFKNAGFRKLITTPHVMPEHYKNTTAGIQAALATLQAHLAQKQIDIIVEAAAEYYLDETLIASLQNNEPLLTFGDRYLLFETNFISEPLHLKEFIFQAQTRGYKPILAHPERYLYLQNHLNKVEDLADRGIFLQVNLGSLMGHYGKGVQIMASKLIDRGYIHLLGSDCHHPQHIGMIEKAWRSRYFKKALTLPLLNNTL